MGTFYLSPTGDNTDGTTLAHAWTSVAKAMVAAALWTGSNTLLVYGTKASPLLMDATLNVLPGMTVDGRGGGDGVLTEVYWDWASASVNEGTVRSDLAVLQPYKQLTSFTQPNAGSYPNVWKATNVDAYAVLYTFAGWTGNLQPLAPFDRANGSSEAGVIAAVNGSSASPKYWAADAGSDLIFYCATNPNSNGVIYVASQPVTVGNGIYQTGGAIYGVACGGTAGCSQSGVSPGGIGNYVMQQNPAQGVSAFASDCFLYHGGFHLWGAVYTGVPGDVTATRVRAEMCPPSTSGWSSYSDEVMVIYAPQGASGDSAFGNVALNSVWQRYQVATVGSVTGTTIHGQGNEGSLLCHDDASNGTGGTGRPFKSLVINGGFMGAVQCNNFMFGSITASGGVIDSIGTYDPLYTSKMFWPYATPTTSRSDGQWIWQSTNDIFRPSNSLNAGSQITGTVTLNHATIDGSVLNSSSGASPQTLFTGAGTLVFSSSNDVVNASWNGNTYVGILAYTASTTTLVSDYNAYVANTIANLGIYLKDGSKVKVSDLTGMGLDGHSISPSLASNLNWSSNYTPGAGSPLLAAASDGGNIGAMAFVGLMTGLVITPSGASWTAWIGTSVTYQISIGGGAFGTSGISGTTYTGTILPGQTVIVQALDGSSNVIAQASQIFGLSAGGANAAQWLTLGIL